jgi:copper(I)-binding protein
MKKLIPFAALSLALVAVAGCGGSSDEATVTDPWVRVTAPKQTNTAAYMKITVTEDDTITAASVPSSVADRAELHETTGSMADSGSMDNMENMDSMDGEKEMDSMTGMKEVSSIKVPADGGVQLKPGGFHVMIMELKKPVSMGEKVPVTLTFEKAGKVTVDAEAREG